MKCVYPLADVLNFPLRYDETWGAITGSGKRTIDLGPLKLIAELKVVGSKVADKEALVLCEGPGDLGLLARYKAVGDQVTLHLIDFASFGENFDPRLALDIDDDIPAAVAGLTLGFVKEFTIGGSATKWQEA
jgi:hypothetical protein